MVYMWRALPGEAYKTLCVVCRTVMHRVTSVCTVFDTSLSGSGSPLNFLKPTHPRQERWYRGVSTYGAVAEGSSVQEVRFVVFVVVDWTDGEGWGVPTLPPLTWRVQPAVCAQSPKKRDTCTPARVALRACRREAILVTHSLSSSLFQFKVC